MNLSGVSFIFLFLSESGGSCFYTGQQNHFLLLCLKFKLDRKKGKSISGVNYPPKADTIIDI